MLVEDNLIFRETLVEALCKYPDLEVVGEARDGAQALELLLTCQPHVVVMDLAMPGLSGLETTELIKKSSPHVHVLIFSMHHDPIHVNQSLRAGASGFVPKTSPAEELVKAIRVVHHGSLQFSPSLLGKA